MANLVVVVGDLVVVLTGSAALERLEQTGQFYVKLFITFNSYVNMSNLQTWFILRMAVIF